MSPEESLIHGYLDDQLSDAQQEQLQAWLRASPENARRFAAMALLHDQLRAQFRSRALISESEIAPSGDLSVRTLANEHADKPGPADVSDGRMTTHPESLSRPSTQMRWRAPMVAVTVMCLALVSLLVVWNDSTGSSAVAATVELRRLVSANSSDDLRKYQIVVEETAVPRAGRQRRGPTDNNPPKPPMQGATLWVRGPNQFVLKRFTMDGRPFLTGSDGHVSWAANPDGPIRVSRDLTRFNRDVPGHESSMPLNHFDEALQQLQKTYDLQLLPVQTPETETDSLVESETAGDPAPSSRLLVAIKRRGERGPERVEILYEPESGKIFQMRFIGMPYGPERLTLRLTLIDSESVDSDFFNFSAHQSSDRRVVEE